MVLKNVEGDTVKQLQLIDGKTRLIETSLVCNSFVATSNNSKSSLSSNYIYLSGDI